MLSRIPLQSFTGLNDSPKVLAASTEWGEPVDRISCQCTCHRPWATAARQSNSTVKSGVGRATAATWDGQRDG